MLKKLLIWTSLCWRIILVEIIVVDIVCVEIMFVETIAVDIIVVGVLVVVEIRIAESIDADNLYWAISYLVRAKSVETMLNNVADQNYTVETPVVAVPLWVSVRCGFSHRCCIGFGVVGRICWLTWLCSNVVGGYCRLFVFVDTPSPG